MDNIKKIEFKDLPEQTPYMKKLMDFIQELNAELKEATGDKRAFVVMGADDHTDSMVLVGCAGDPGLLEQCVEGMLSHPALGNLVTFKVTERMLQERYSDRGPSNGNEIIIN